MPDYSNYPSDKYNWEYVYGNTKKENPYNLPYPKGREVKITMFADANFYQDKVTERFVIGLLMLNSTPIDWFSKKQNCVATATYGSEFVAARFGVDKIVQVRFMLRMFGIPMSGPSIMFGDNLAVINSSAIPDNI